MVFLKAFLHFNHYIFGATEPEFFPIILVGRAIDAGIGTASTRNNKRIWLVNNRKRISRIIQKMSSGKGQVVQVFIKRTVFVMDNCSILIFKGDTLNHTQATSLFNRIH